MRQIKGYVDRFMDVLSPRRRDMKILCEFEKGLEDLLNKKRMVQKEHDEFLESYRQQVLSYSLEIQKGNTEVYLVDNLKFLESKKDKVEKGYIEDLRDSIIEIDTFQHNYSEFREQFSKAHEMKYKTYLPGSLGRTRDSMPQIKDSEIDSFLLHFAGKSKTTKVTKLKMKLKDLKPTQKEFNEDKIIQGLGNSNWKKRIYIISKDNYLLDGHHSWGSGLEMNEDQEVSVYKVNLPIKELLRRSNLLKISSKKDVQDNIVKSLFDDFITTDEEFLLVLDSNKLVLTSPGYHKLVKGEKLIEEDILKGEILDIVSSKGNFQKDIKYLKKGESEHCVIFYACNDVVDFEKAKTEDSEKFKKVMGEFKDGTLTDPEGNKVTSRDQAIAIAYSESGEKEKKEEKSEVVQKSEASEVEKSEQTVEVKEEKKPVTTKKKNYADIIIQNKVGQILLLKRSANDTFGAGMWSLPGGSIEEGETAEEAVKREAQEEIGVYLSEIIEAKVFQNKDSATETHYFYCDYDDSQIILDSSEHDNYIWATREEMRDLPLLLDLKLRIKQMF